jgi:hypothetical protein
MANLQTVLTSTALDMKKELLDSVFAPNPMFNYLSNLSNGVTIPAGTLQGPLVVDGGTLMPTITITRPTPAPCPHRATMLQAVEDADGVVEIIKRCYDCNIELWRKYLAPERPGLVHAGRMLEDD